MKLADGHDAIAPVGCDPFQGGIDDAGRGRAGFVKREAVGGVHNHGHTGETRGEASDETGFRGVGVHDLVGPAEEEAAQTGEAAQIPNWPDLAADDIQVHQAQTELTDRLLKDGVCGEHIDLPALGLGDLA